MGFDESFNFTNFSFGKSMEKARSIFSMISCYSRCDILSRHYPASVVNNLLYCKTDPLPYNERKELIIANYPCYYLS